MLSRFPELLSMRFVHMDNNVLLIYDVNPNFSFSG